MKEAAYKQISSNVVLLPVQHYVSKCMSICMCVLVKVLSVSPVFIVFNLNIHMLMFFS